MNMIHATNSRKKKMPKRIKQKEIIFATCNTCKKWKLTRKSKSFDKKELKLGLCILDKNKIEFSGSQPLCKEYEGFSGEIEECEDILKIKTKKGKKDEPSSSSDDNNLFAGI
jgi:hypothetical protein